MPDSIPPREPRRPTNVTLPQVLLDQARALKINISAACEAGLAAQVKAARAQQWLEENREAIQAYHKYVEENGLTLERYRTF
jgi:antitoxin CcdA